MDLPIEILMHIFKYLPFSDKIAVSQVCRLWYEAVHDKRFRDIKVVSFFKTLIENDSCVLKTFNNSMNTFHNFTFKEVEVTNKMTIFWLKHGSKIRSLRFDSCDIREKIFMGILKECRYLESLTIHSCRELFMSGRLLGTDDEGLAFDNLPKLKCLALSGNRYLSDAIFNRFALIAPALEELCLSECSVSFHSGLYKKFYPFSFDSNGVTTPSDNVLTFYYILRFIIAHASTLKKLSFCDTLFDSVALQKLSEIPNLKLEILNLHSCDQLTNNGITALTNHQIYLKELNLGMCSRVTDQSLVSICGKLLNLEHLNIEQCRSVGNIGAIELFKLKKLKFLNISQCELISGSGIERGICREQNTVLSTLILRSLDVDQRIIVIISEKVPNLDVLDLSSCFNAVTDSSIQAIFKNLTRLRTLKLSRCDKVSDAGLTGMGKQNNDNNPNSNCSDITSIATNTSSNLKISLRSRAEDEIVNDARRKNDVMRMCENLDTESSPGYSLARLKCLRELDISGCNRITDVSLRYAFFFKELKTLNLSNCQQITHDGLLSIVTNCPSIETLYLIDCYSIKDDGVVNLINGLARLKYLHLRGCNQLSDVSIETIQSACLPLKVLDIQRCRNITPELASSLSSIPTLHTLLLSKPGPYVTDNMKYRLPIAPELPLFANLRRRIF